MVTIYSSNSHNQKFFGILRLKCLITTALDELSNMYITDVNENTCNSIILAKHL